jgi:ATP-dependent helicase HrpA
LSRGRAKEPTVPAYFEQITHDLDELLPANFIQLYPVDRIIRIPRLLEAMKIRLGRARIDPEKDKAKAAQVEPFEFALSQFEAETPGAGAKLGTQYQFPNYGGEPRTGKSEISIVSPILEKRRAVAELRRMIEEFKISLFAPEVKTAFPISAVRLARKIKEIEAIV